VADNAVINVFAGLTRGTLCPLNLNPVAQRGVRFTGTSGSSIDDLRHMRDLVESKQLPTNHSVAAIAGLEGVGDGLHAVAEGRFAGKVVIFPNLSKPLPLTPLTELDKVLPSVAARLDPTACGRTRSRGRTAAGDVVIMFHVHVFTCHALLL
jgi:hypothetical protein